MGNPGLQTLDTGAVMRKDRPDFSFLERSCQPGKQYENQEIQCKEDFMRKASLLVLIVALGLATLWASPAYAGTKKILYVDSYHPEYKGNVPVRKAFAEGISKMDIDVRYEYMDAKHKKSADLQKTEALRIREIIKQWQPDLIVAADDSANKYLVVPYYKGTSIPVVFNGVNFSASAYGYPANNVTGQIEVELIVELISRLQEFSRGKRLGILTGDTLTDRKSVKLYSEILKLTFDQVSFVNRVDDWKEQFLKLQKSVDILILRNNAGIAGWDAADVQQFVNENTSVPTGGVTPHLCPFSLVCYPKNKEEFGEISSRMVVDILTKGKSPSDIPIVSNKKSSIYLNMKIAKKLGVLFPMDLIENARLISAEKKKLFYVNSYHKGFKWSDDIEKGLLKALNIKALPDGTFDTSKSEVELRVFRMDTKLNTSEAFKKQAALSAKAIIDEWQPDIVVTSDDNAAKYLIVPYYMNSAIPFVFCGVSWDASDYGFPASNVTGMVEVAPVPQIMELLKTYAKGNRLGFIGSDNLTSHRDIEYQVKIYELDFTEGKFVSTFDEWKKEYLRLQNTVDMIMWTNPIGIKGWDNVLALEYILGNTIIPSAGTSDNIVRFALLGMVRIAEEQGWWSGKTALRILEGTDPADIPIVGNKGSRLYLNMELAKRLKIKFPMELIKEATFLKDQPD